MTSIWHKFRVRYDDYQQRRYERMVKRTYQAAGFAMAGPDERGHLHGHYWSRPSFGVTVTTDTRTTRHRVLDQALTLADIARHRNSITARYEGITHHNHQHWP